MHEFCRVAWASDEARAVWETRFHRVSRAWLEVELKSVKTGLRSAALVFGEDLVKRSGLPAVNVAPDRFAVGPVALELAEAYKRQDDRRVGELLGFPACCRTFFDRVWNVESKRDTTLSMAGDGSGPAEANILGRWLGVRFVPHLPCSWNCTQSVQFAKHLESLWPAEELGWAREILSWSVKYSALHGIAIVTFPVVKVVTNTDYTRREIAIERAGSLPAESPSGLSFPFTTRRNFVPLASLKKAVAAVDPREWMDNGFSSRQAMEDAHGEILHALLRIHSREACCDGSDPRCKGYTRGSISSVLDLGCGNGKLLSKIPATVRVGLEADPERAARGRAAHMDIRTGRIQEVEKYVTETFKIALVSVRRLEELNDTQREAFRVWLRSHVADVLLYSYDSPRFARIISSSEV